MEKIAIYPGSFDPVTNGHLDIVERGLKIFDKIIVAIMHNPTKTSLFSVDERFTMLKKSMQDFNNRVEFASFYGLTVDYAAKRKAHAILRGLRAVSDFEYEFQMALMNRRLNREIQTLFLMTGLRWIFTSSSIIKEAAKFGGNIEDMVPDFVNEKIKEKFKTG
ncbi:MAG: pantetheine-phosphate adenylyltransferase [Deltaproteobacteria bacterium]|jgi:pantetheine-phosphate adenylyltransferase|nr:pantetheine-phosphate adenylyltransferase [Deltaproteobacteria bacterium]